MKKPQAKVARVMREFKSGELKSSSGQKVTNPKQAIAIGLSEAGISKKAKGGEMKESKAMAKKEVSFMKKKGAPKSMIKHEMAEYGMKRGGGVKKMATGGKSAPAPKPTAPSGKAAPFIPGQGGRGIPVMPPTPPRSTGFGPTGPVNQAKLDSIKSMIIGKPSGQMASGGKVKKMASGGLAAGHKSADGIAKKGKTRAEMIKMATGGKSAPAPKPTAPKKMAAPYIPGQGGRGLPPPRNNPPMPIPMSSGPVKATAPGIPSDTPPTRGSVPMMKKGGNVKKMASGGLAAGHKSADGIARKGKTKAEQIKMAKGGMAKSKKYC